MDLEYILQSDKLLFEQKNKWKELDEFFKTNSKYYKSIDNEDTAFLVYPGGAGGDFILNTFFIDSLDKSKYNLLNHYPTISKNRYWSHTASMVLTTLVNPVLTSNNVFFQKTLKVPNIFSEYDDDNFKKNISEKAKLADFKLNYFKIHSLPVIPYFYYKNFEKVKVINIIPDVTWIEFCELLSIAKLKIDEILSTVDPIFFRSSSEQQTSMKNVFKYVKNLLESKENFKLIFPLIAQAIVININNVDNIIEKIIKSLKTYQGDHGVIGTAWQGKVLYHKGIQDRHKANCVKQVNGKPWSGMLDFLSDNQMYNISYGDLFCNQNTKIIAQLMEVYNSPQPIEYYAAQLKAYHERNLELSSNLNDEIILALEILTHEHKGS